MLEEKDDLYDTKWFRGLILTSLLAGAGGGISALTQDTADRYKASEARADFAVRDKSLARGDERLSKVEIALANHLQHSAKYSQIILDLKDRFEQTSHPPLRVEAMLADYEKRLRDLEKSK